MNKIIITLIGICLYSLCFSQKVEGLKKSSDNHNSNSGNKSGGSSGTKLGSGSGNQGSRGGSDYSGGAYSEIDPSCLLDGCSLLFDILSDIDYSSSNTSTTPETYNTPEPEPKPNKSIVVPDSLPNAIPPAEMPNSENLPEYRSEKKIEKEEPVITIPFEKFSISVRGSFYPSGFHIWVPEIMGSKDAFSYSLRLLTIAEQRLDKVDYYSTFDFQPFQINFINTRDVLFKIGIGGMAETYSDMIYIEMTSNIKWRINNKFDLGLEGRWASQRGITIRNEASLQANYSIWQKNNKQFFIGFNGMLSRYYETEDVNVVSFATGYRF